MKQMKVLKRETGPLLRGEIFLLAFQRALLHGGSAGLVLDLVVGNRKQMYWDNISKYQHVDLPLLNLNVSDSLSQGE